MPYKLLLCLLAIASSAEAQLSGLILRDALNGPPITEAGVNSTIVLQFAYPLNINVVPTVTLGGQTLSPLHLLLQYGLILYIPMDFPLGLTTITVSYQGQTSKPAAITIVTFRPQFGPPYYFSTVTASRLQISEPNPAAPGQTVEATVFGLGATNPIIRQMDGSLAPTVATPQIKIGGKSAEVVKSVGGFGGYYVDFVVPPDLAVGNYDLILSIGGVATSPITFPVGNGAPAIVAVEGAATYNIIITNDGSVGPYPATPNSFISIYASNLGNTASDPNIFPSTDFQGIEVLFDGKPAPLYNVTPSANLINLVVPSELPSSGTTTVTMKNAKGTGPSFKVPLGPAGVGIFQLPAPGCPVFPNGAVLFANTAWFVMSDCEAKFYGLPKCTGLPVTTPCGQPAEPGDNIVVYFTGGGLATPDGDPSGRPIPTGSVAPVDGSVLYKTVQTPVVTIRGYAAPVSFSGIAPGTAAEYQINTTIPMEIAFFGNNDHVPLNIVIGESQSGVYIAVQKP